MSTKMSIYLLIFYDKKKMEIFNDRIVIWLNPHHKWARVYKEFMSLLTPLSHQKTKPFLEDFFFPICTIFFWRDFAPLSKAKLSKVLIFNLFLSFIICVCVNKKHTRKMLGWMASRHSLILHLASLFWTLSLSLSLQNEIYIMPYLLLYICVSFIDTWKK